MFLHPPNFAMTAQKWRVGIWVSVRGHSHALRGGGVEGGAKVGTKNPLRGKEGKGAKRSVATSWIDVKGYADPIR